MIKMIMEVAIQDPINLMLKTCFSKSKRLIMKYGTYRFTMETLIWICSSLDACDNGWERSPQSLACLDKSINGYGVVFQNINYDVITLINPEFITSLWMDTTKTKRELYNKCGMR